MSDLLHGLARGNGPHGPATGVTVRAMVPADCAAVAAIRVRGWQFAYAGLMPQAYLDAMDVEAETDKRREILLGSPDAVVNLVADRAGAVVGWGCYGPSRDTDVPEGTAELYTLYVLPEQVSSGVGRTLLASLLDRAGAAGHRLMVLWVVSANARARRFYARAGFAPDGAEEPYEVLGVEVPELRYARALSAEPAAPASRG